MNVRPNLSLIEAVSQNLRDMLGEDFDTETFFDTLDGETDAVEIIDRLLASMAEDEAMADAVKAQVSDMSARMRRFCDRAAAKRRTIKLVLDATGERKVERPLATVSIQAGRLSVNITDEASVPTQLCKVVKSPDKTAIKKQIEAGETVPGAELVRGEDTLAVRRG